MPLGKRFGAEIIEDQFAVPAEGFGDLFHWFDARTHDLTTPVVEELGGRCRGVVVPRSSSAGWQQRAGSTLAAISLDPIASISARIARGCAPNTEMPPALVRPRRRADMQIASGWHPAHHRDWYNIKSP